MADLTVCFSRYIAGAPIAEGDVIRTELIAIGASSAPGNLIAGPKDRFVHLVAGADCWVAVGEDPEAESPDNSEGWAAVWPIKSGATLDLAVEANYKVAVIQV